MIRCAAERALRRQRSRWCSSLPLRGRQVHLEDRSPGHAGKLDVSLMCSDDVLGDRQPQTGAGWFGGEKRQEDPLLELLGDTGSIIHNVDLDVLAPSTGRCVVDLDGDGPAIIAQRLYSVCDQVVKHLLEGAGIPPDHRYPGINLEVSLYLVV